MNKYQIENEDAFSIQAVTWQRESHNLFDYQSKDKDLVKSNLNVTSEC